MGEKIFGEIANTEDLNELANNLRKTKEFEEIRLLCKENNIPDDICEEFVKGNRVTLATISYLKSRKALQSPTWQVGLSYTIDDVKKKLVAELEIYRDGDSKYVVEKLIELCGSDSELLAAIMLPHKSYDKAFQYFYECSRTIGYKMPHGNMVYLDNDRAVRLSVDYFKRDDEKAEKKEPLKTKQQTTDKLIPNVQGNKTEVIKSAVKAVDPKKEILVKEQQPDSKPKKYEISGQLSLFDF